MGALSNDKDRFFLQFNKNRVIGSGSDESEMSISEQESDHVVPISNIEKRENLQTKLQKYLRSYENRKIPDKHLKFLQGVLIEQMNIFDEKKRLDKQKR